MAAGFTVAATISRILNIRPLQRSVGKAHTGRGQQGNVVFTQNAAEGNWLQSQGGKRKEYLIEKEVVFEDMEWSQFTVRMSRGVPEPYWCLLGMGMSMAIPPLLLS